MNRMIRSRKRQQGSTIVETAIAILLFLTLVFAVIEMAFALFHWLRIAEATRSGARYAIVNDPAFDISAATDSCSTVSGAPNAAMLAAMNDLALNLASDDVVVTYSCADTGFAERPTPVLTITVAVAGINHRLLVPQLFALEPTIPIPGFASTRTSEDLATVTGS